MKQVYVGSTPVKAVYVGAKKVWPTREVVQITLGPGVQARDQLLNALTARGLDSATVTEIPFDIELVGTGSAQYMFLDYPALTSAPVMNTGNVTEMLSMFYNCVALTTVPDMDTSSVTNMRYMFRACASLTHAPAMDTSSVTDMGAMFQDCSSLTSVPDLETANVTNAEWMFVNCSSLTDGNVRLIGKNAAASTTGMIASSGLTREPWYTADGRPVDVHNVSLTNVLGSGTIHPLLTVTVPAGETWQVRIQGTVTKASTAAVYQPHFRIGVTNSGKYGSGAAVDFSGTVTAANSTIALVTNSSVAASFTGTVTIEK